MQDCDQIKLIYEYNRIWNLITVISHFLFLQTCDPDSTCQHWNALKYNCQIKMVEPWLASDPTEVMVRNTALALPDYAFGK